MRFILFIVLFITLVSNNLLAQLISSQVGSASNIEKKEEEKFSSVIIGADYSTNTNTFGKFSSFASQPSFSPALSLYHKSGVFVNGVLNIIGKSDSSATKATYQVNLKGGYEIKISDKFTITPSYTRYIYDEKALTISTLYKNYAEVNMDMETKYWFGMLSAGYLWGRINEFSIDARTGFTYNWDNVLFKEDVLMVQLSFSGFFNNPNYLSQLFSFLNDYAEANPNATKGKLILDLAEVLANRTPEVKEIRRTFKADPTLRKMVNNYLPYGIPVKEFLNYNNRFTLTSLACSLPVTYMVGNFTINLDFSVYRTLNQPVYSEQDSYYSYVTAGLSYSFNW